MKTIGRVKGGAVALCIAASSMVAAVANAQAWVAPKGEADVSLIYQFNDYHGHLDYLGHKRAEQGSQAQIVTLDVDYSVTDRFAVSFSVPYVFARLGSNPVAAFRGHPAGANDGHYHGTWEDYALDLRYNILMQPFVVTPFLSFIVPSHHYQTVAVEAVGRDLHETHVGFNIGRTLDPLLPKAYVDTHLGYVFSEKSLGISTNRTVADIGAGYFVTPRFTARGVISYQQTYGGLTSKQVLVDPITPELFQGHDRLLRDTHLRAGVSGSFSVGPRTDVYAGYVHTLWGKNSHYGYGITAGVSRAFPRAR
jgi:hypothetical protein